MDLKKLKEVLIQNKIFVDDKSKNYICECYKCGDHPDPKKKGHLYVSKNSQIPIAHCFFCNRAWGISKLIQDLTGDKNLSKSIVPEEQERHVYKTKKRERFRKFKIPSIQDSQFIYKNVYLQKRTNNKITTDQIPNIIYNFSEFFNVNNLDIVGKEKILSNFEMDLLQKNFVGFLSHHHTILYCRNIDSNSKFKFRKIPLQNDPLLLLDYWSISNDDPTRNGVVLSEGNFDLLGEYVSQSLQLEDQTRVWASGNTFAYSSLLKSVCFDNDLFKINLTILSDSDKSKKKYYRFLKENKHIIDSCKIYINRSGEDFGIFPVRPSRIL